MVAGACHVGVELRNARGMVQNDVEVAPYLLRKLSSEASIATHALFAWSKYAAGQE